MNYANYECTHGGNLIIYHLYSSSLILCRIIQCFNSYLNPWRKPNICSRVTDQLYLMPILVGKIDILKAKIRTLAIGIINQFRDQFMLMPYNRASPARRFRKCFSTGLHVKNKRNLTTQFWEEPSQTGPAGMGVHSH